MVICPLGLHTHTDDCKEESFLLTHILQGLLNFMCNSHQELKLQAVFFTCSLWRTDS
jgi:hypothetical protein